MKNDLGKLENLIYETLAYVARIATYRREPVSEQLDKALKQIESFMHPAYINAIREGIDTQIKMDHAKGISAEQVVADRVKLSIIATQFGKNLAEANKIYLAINDTLAQNERLGQDRLSQKQILEQFKVKESNNPLLDSQRDVGKDHNLSR